MSKTVHCQICGLAFETTKKRKYYFCKLCRKYNKTEINEIYRERMERYVEREKTPLDIMTAEILEFNKAHGTNLSYGKYVAMKERGARYVLM